MKLGKLILASFLLIGTSSFAQEDAEKECKRMRFLAGEELTIKNYKGSAKYYILGEKICGGYDAANYARLIGSVRNAIIATEKEEKTAYTDTVVTFYNKIEEKGFYDKKDDLLRASYILQSSNPDRKKADELFRRGIAAQGAATNEGYVSYFYYNTYAIYSAAAETVKADLKKRMISDYFEMSALIGKANMSIQTQETITEYFNYVVKDCKDILPEITSYIENLSTEKESRLASLMNFITLLENKACTDAPEYGQLINSYVDTDPTSLDAQLMKAKYLMSKGSLSEAITTLRTAKEITTEDAKKQEITYTIALAQFKSKSYTAAYNTAMSVSGEHKGNALSIAGKCVGNNANNCGASTFDRKCNYIYAVQLLEKARSLGGDTGNSISSYKSRFPTTDDCFQNGNVTSITLSCYNVTVNPCK